MAKKTRYKPVHPEKYAGNADNIICRSSWERRVCIWLDREPNILSWSSEEAVIPYWNPVKKRMARYFPDFVIKVKKANGNIVVKMLEVKPLKETRRPDQKRKKSKYYLRECATYATNESKWKAAIEFCKDRGWTFELITEKELGLD